MRKSGFLFIFFVSCLMASFVFLGHGQYVFASEKESENTRAEASLSDENSQNSEEISGKTQEQTTEQKSRISYNYEFVFAENTDEILPEIKQDMIKLMVKNSQLEFLKDQAIENEFALIRRINNDIDIAEDVLKSYGYYSGYAKYALEDVENKKHVIITLYPEEQYKIDTIAIKYTHSTALPKYFLTYKNKRNSIFDSYTPYTAPQFAEEVKVDTPYAIAENILAAVDDLPRPLRSNGYPNAKVASSAYSIDKENKELKGTVFINQGLPAILGDVDLTGNTEVSSEYILKLCPWRPGTVWDDRFLLKYRERLQKTGLFEHVHIEYDKKTYREYNRKYREDRKEKQNKDIVLEPVTLPVLLNVKEGKKKSIGGSAYYSTDDGPGAEILWEHRNILGNGEILQLSMPLKDDALFLAANFKKPAFGCREQNLIVRSRIGYEKTDAYNQKFAEFGFGIEREIHEKWWLESLLNFDHIIPKKWQGESYSSIAFANTLKYDDRNSRINPTEGFISSLKLMPMHGFSHVEFTAFVTEFDTSVYLPLGDKTVLALRAAVGTMFGGDNTIPRSKRFFLGGGGSVRGFEYQEIGRHDGNDDPYGGISYTLFNSEVRQNVTKDLALVGFVDGGMVYEEVTPDFSETMAIGAGVGLRYNTPIGPVRFDIAVPLTDAFEDKVKKEITDYQLYISIGQAF